MFLLVIVYINNERLYTNNSKQEFIIMAQVLKDEVRERIIVSAKQELLKNGYKDSSMRSIAKGAGVTVGNLYRYFTSKDELIKTIVGDTLLRINEFVKKNTDDGVSLEKDDFSWQIQKSDLTTIINDLGDELVKIYYERPEEMLILLMHSRISAAMDAWLTRLIYYFISQMIDSDETTAVKTAVAKSYAASIIGGIREIFVSDKLDQAEMTTAVRIYLSGFIMMIDASAKRK